MAAMVVRAIDQQSANAHLAHFAHCNFLVLSHQRISSMRFTDGCFGFLTLSQCGDGPARYLLSRRLETMPSSPNLQAARNRSEPISPASNGATKMPSGRRARSRARLVL